MKNEILINLRKEKKLTQKELAKKINVSVSTIGMMESGERNGSIEVLNKIAAFFNVSIDYLTGTTTERKGYSDKKKQLVSNFLEYLIDTGMIEDVDNIDKDTENLIMNMVKTEMALIKAERGKDKK